MANQLHPATSGDRSWSADAHLRSPKAWRNLDPCCCVVGLAIVVALDNTAGAASTPPPTTIVSAVTSSRTSNMYSGGTFTAESPATMIGGAFEGFQVAYFLNRCNLCMKWLHGKDIYMYRGEKGFCSTECRYQQMIIDENQEFMVGNDEEVDGDAELAVRRRRDLLSAPCCVLTEFALR